MARGGRVSLKSELLTRWHERRVGAKILVSWMVFEGVYKQRQRFSWVDGSEEGGGRESVGFG